MELFSEYVILAAILLNIENIRPLKLMGLHVPEYVTLGSNTFLSCVWNLENTEKLYSVKWYKDGKEFYRYVPRDIQPHKTFLLPGVGVKTFDPTGSNISLLAATLDTEGRYRCEVSGEKPYFLTASKYTDLVVVVLPDHSPKVTYLRPQYTIGNRIEVNCTSGRSRPETTLSWYTNNVPEQFSPPPKYIEHKDGLKTTVRTLDFTISGRLYPMGRLKLKCLATIPNLYWASIEVGTIITRSTLRNNMYNNNFSARDKRNEINNLKNSTYSNYSRSTSSSITFLIFIIYCNIF